jgi:hypothetical protein
MLEYAQSACSAGIWSTLLITYRISVTGYCFFRAAFSGSFVPAMPAKVNTNLLVKVVGYFSPFVRAHHLTFGIGLMFKNMSFASE